MENLTRKVGTFNYNNGTSTASRFTDTDNSSVATTFRVDDVSLKINAE